MAKTKDELNEIKKEFETLTIKLQELSDDELKQVTGGIIHKPCSDYSEATCIVCNNHFCELYGYYH